MTARELMYEGKSKQVWSTDDPGRVVLRFKDDATAFNGVKHELFSDKAKVNAAISRHLFEAIANEGVPTHLVQVLSPTEQLCDKVDIIPVEVIVRNICAGSLAKRYGRQEGEALPRPMTELFYKSDELNDPLMSREVALIFGWATDAELDQMIALALRINDVVKAFWDGLGIDLVDFKVEFGRTADGRVVLADELSPDGSRLWEKGTRKRFDKDVFRRDLGDLGERYRELYERVFGEGL